MNKQKISVEINNLKHLNQKIAKTCDQILNMKKQSKIKRQKIIEKYLATLPEIENYELEYNANPKETTYNIIFKNLSCSVDITFNEYGEVKEKYLHNKDWADWKRNIIVGNPRNLSWSPWMLQNDPDKTTWQCIGQIYIGVYIFKDLNNTIHTTRTSNFNSNLEKKIKEYKPYSKKPQTILLEISRLLYDQIVEDYNSIVF